MTLENKYLSSDNRPCETGLMVRLYYYRQIKKKNLYSLVNSIAIIRYLFIDIRSNKHLFISLYIQV